jgi:transcriptional regulator with XRE-family HTH domain
MKQRGRPKGRSNDPRSFGPLGDLIRKNRLDRGLGLSDVASACGCSVQFISNIEHGRAPLPWDKVPALARCLELDAEELQAANLTARSDFRTFVGLTAGSSSKKAGTARGRRVPTPAVLRQAKGTASALALTARDPQLQEVLTAYQTASATTRKKFVKAALKLLES